MAVKMVACPQCGAGVEWNPANRFRPFCSERCKLTDLGAWATERYRVPVAETDPSAIADDDEGAPRPS
jgi:endogenous inhibitor of DNA gyrase (YacG/DUF329 family)